jgi:radical SAM superfamily enzyme YgiQ (UPF0313 family)
VLIISPLHSVTSPTVGVGYLAAELKLHGLECPVLDLNIGLKKFLESQRVEKGWLEWIFPFGERTFGGELLLSMACLDRKPSEILAAAGKVTNKNFQEFFQRLNPEPYLLSREAERVSLLIRSYLSRAALKIAEEVKDWIGFSVVVTNQVAVIYLVRTLSELRPDLRIVLGGPHFNSENVKPWAEAFSQVDAIIVGEGRSALAAWVTKSEDAMDGQIVRRSSHPPRIRMQPTASPPWKPADWSMVDWNSYLNVTADSFAERASAGAAIPVMGAQGCSYNRCTFCYEVLLAPRHHPRQIEDVVEEICLQRSLYGREDFFFTDLDFNSDYQRTIDLADLIKKKSPGIRFHCWLRAHELDELILMKLYEAGAKSWFVGIEAVTDHLLSLMRKGYNGAHARKVIKTMADFAEKRNVRYGFNLIPNYPGETIEDVIETFEVISSERHNFLGRTAALYEFTLTPNTIAWLQRDSLGLRNLVGWNEVLLPSDLRGLPSHRYWYEEEDTTDSAQRQVLWDHVRVLIGHDPQYVEIKTT